MVLVIADVDVIERGGTPALPVMLSSSLWPTGVYATHVLRVKEGRDSGSRRLLSLFVPKGI